jgi:hypothetical protein
MSALCSRNIAVAALALATTGCRGCNQDLQVQADAAAILDAAAPVPMVGMPPGFTEHSWSKQQVRFGLPPGARVQEVDGALGLPASIDVVFPSGARERIKQGKLDLAAQREWAQTFAPKRGMQVLLNEPDAFMYSSVVDDGGRACTLIACKALGETSYCVSGSSAEPSHVEGEAGSTGLTDVQCRELLATVRSISAAP